MTSTTSTISIVDKKNLSTIVDENFSSSKLFGGNHCLPCDFLPFSPLFLPPSLKLPFVCFSSLHIFHLLFCLLQWVLHSLFNFKVLILAVGAALPVQLPSSRLPNAATPKAAPCLSTNSHLPIITYFWGLLCMRRISGFWMWAFWCYRCNTQ